LGGNTLNQPKPSSDAMDKYMSDLNASLRYTPDNTDTPTVPNFEGSQTLDAKGGYYAYNAGNKSYEYVPNASSNSSSGSSALAYNQYDPAGDADGGGPGGGAPADDGMGVFAAGGVMGLSQYAAGGKLLRGDGDGMSDSIPAVINGPTPQRAALADGEFVIPADVVSHLGNGSTEAGSKRLYSMMSQIRKARTGNPKQGKQINPNKFLPQ
jgi:hypothetical protein